MARGRAEGRIFRDGRDPTRIFDSCSTDRARAELGPDEASGAVLRVRPDACGAPRGVHPVA
jgi:hypothetical protein